VRSRLSCTYLRVCEITFFLSPTYAHIILTFQHTHKKYRYMAMMIVCANDPIASIRDKSMSKLLYFVRIRHRESKAWLASRQDDEDEDETTRAMSLTMAEYILPYAIHLIAHMPTFSDRPMSEYYLTEGSKVEKSSIAKYLKAAFAPLLKIRNSSTSDVVFEILDRISKSIDAVKPNCSNTRLLAEIAQKMLLDDFHFDQIDRRFCRVILPLTMYVDSSNKGKKRPSPSKNSPRRVKARTEKRSENLENSSQNRVDVQEEEDYDEKKRMDVVLDGDDDGDNEEMQDKKRKKKKFTSGFGKIDSSNIVDGSRRRMR